MSSSPIDRRTALGLAAAAAVPLLASRRATAQMAAMTPQTAMIDAWSFFEADERFVTWARLILAGGLRDYTRAPTPFTVFPPTEAAFAQFPEVVKYLLGYQSVGASNSGLPFPDTSKIVKTVRSHTLAGRHPPSEMLGRVSLKSLAGTDVIVDGSKSPVTITWKSVVNKKTLSARITHDPIIALNAVIYPVDAIFIEES